MKTIRKPDWKRVKEAMKSVAKHKLKHLSIDNASMNILAHTATRMMWLIEEENRARDSGE